VKTGIIEDAARTHHGKQALPFANDIDMGHERSGGNLPFPPDALYIAGIRGSYDRLADLIEAPIGGLVHDTD